MLQSILIAARPPVSLTNAGWRPPTSCNIALALMVMPVSLSDTEKGNVTIYILLSVAFIPTRLKPPVMATIIAFMNRHHDAWKLAGIYDRWLVSTPDDREHQGRLPAPRMTTGKLQSEQASVSTTWPPSWQPAGQRQETGGLSRRPSKPVDWYWRAAGEALSSSTVQAHLTLSPGACT